MIQQMLAYWSLVLLTFLNSAWTIWKFSVHIMLKPSLKNFQHYFANMWDEFNCAHLSCHSRMSGSRWVITPSWLSGSWRGFCFCFCFCFVQFFCVFYHLFFISSTSLWSISVVYCAHLFMKCSLGISNFLEEISSLSLSIVFLYFFALITEEGFLISPCYSLELCIQMGILPLFSSPFHFFSFLSYL